MSSWIKIEDGLPEKYEDVFLLLKDGTRCIGRMNHHGSWLKASYQKCRWQYAVDKESVVAWCKAPE